MPPVLIAIAAAAGFFAVARGFAKALDAELERRAAEDEKRRAANAEASAKGRRPNRPPVGAPSARETKKSPYFPLTSNETFAVTR